MSYTISIIQNCLVFTIERNKRRNAINFDVMDGLKDFVSQLHTNTTILAGVITGSGSSAFCSGGDLQEFHALETEQQALSMLKPMADILFQLATAPVPTIALVNGHAVGGGCEIATACDFRVVHEGAKAGFIQGKLAITTGWGGATYLLNKLPSKQEAFRMLLHAEPLNAKTLATIGWANDVYEEDPLNALQFVVDRYLTMHPSVMRAYKQRVLQQLDWQEVHGRIDTEVKECARLWEQPAHHEAVKQFLDKRSI